MPRLLIRDFGTGIRFDGSGNQHISISDANSLDLAKPTPFTLSAWVNYTPNGARQFILTKCDLGLQTVGAYAMSISATGKLQFTHVALTDKTDTGAAISSNSWNHVGITYPGNDTIRFFVNGNLNSSLTAADAINANTGTLIIGRYTDNTTRLPFNGSIDEVCIWNGLALSDSQMAVLAKTGQAPTTNLSLRMLFNEGSGGSVADSSGNNNNGTITGATFTSDVVSKARLAVT